MAHEPVSLGDLIEFVKARSGGENALVSLGDAVLVSQRLGEQADHLVGHFVDEARRAGSSWSAIGERLGVSKQAAQQRFVPGVANTPQDLDAEMFSRFTLRAQKAVAIACEEASSSNGGEVDTEHLLIGLSSEPECIAAKALAAQGVTPERVRSAVGAVGASPAASPAERVRFAPRAKKAFHRATREALLTGLSFVTTESYIGTEHVLLAILADDEGVAAGVLRDLGVTEERTRKLIGAELSSTLTARSGAVQGIESTTDPAADIGHVHLKVSDLDRAVAFYRDVIGMESKNAPDGAAFLTFGRYHHHVALNTWESKGGEPPTPGATGLYHFAIRFSTRRGLAAALKRVVDAGVQVDSTSDCGGTADSIYLRDPDQNGVELTWDRPRESRPKPSPKEDHPLDLQALLGELD